MGNVDFLFEIMKHRTAATPVSREGMKSLLPQTLPEPHFAGIGSSAFDANERSEATTRYSNFDYYGNLIRGTSRPHINRVRFVDDEIREYKDIFEYNGSNDEHESGCLKEFGQYIRGLFCQMESFYERKRKHELNVLRTAVGEAAKSKALLELELRSQLLEIRRQRDDMENAFRQEIAREFSEKVIRQAQLQAKLLSMIEQRVSMEIQLGRLDLHDQSSQRIPTATGTPIHNEQDGRSTSKFRHIQLGTPPPARVARTKTPNGTEVNDKGRPVTGKLSLSILTNASSMGPELPFSPTHCFSPESKMGNAKGKVTFFDETDSATVTKARSSKAPPGLSIVVENSEPSSERREYMPTATPVTFKGEFESVE